MRGVISEITFNGVPSTLTGKYALHDMEDNLYSTRVRSAGKAAANAPGRGPCRYGDVLHTEDSFSHGVYGPHT